MKLVLFINGQKADIMNLDLVATNSLQWQLLYRNAREKILLQNRILLMGAGNWELFLYRKSKM